MWTLVLRAFHEGVKFACVPYSLVSCLYGVSSGAIENSDFSPFLRNYVQLSRIGPVGALFNLCARLFTE